MTPWLQLINNCTALKHRLDFFFKFSFWRKLKTRKKKKKKKINHILSLKLFTFLSPKVGSIWWVHWPCFFVLFCFVFFLSLFVCFFLVCLLPCLFVFSLVCLEIIESIIKSFITFGLFALIFFTYQSTLKQDFWQVSASSLHFSK